MSSTNTLLQDGDGDNDNGDDSVPLKTEREQTDRHAIYFDLTAVHDGNLQDSSSRIPPDTVVGRRRLQLLNSRCGVMNREESWSGRQDCVKHVA